MLLLSLLGILIPTALNTLTFRQAQDFPEHVAKVLLFSPYSKGFTLWQLAKIMLGSPVGGSPRTPVQGEPCTRPNLLSPPYLKEDLKPLPKPLAILARGLKLIPRENPLHQSFGMALQPLPLRGSPFLA